MKKQNKNKIKTAVKYLVVVALIVVLFLLVATAPEPKEPSPIYEIVTTDGEVVEGGYCTNGRVTYEEHPGLFGTKTITSGGSTTAHCTAFDGRTIYNIKSFRILRWE